ncbi:WD40-like Beta Propeller Repeat [Pseudarcicella hirudinis]|uniref:WD40-like Beta Propeller Repeat n=2 Tax=Pseudarcicella hirudinis TaxID=1079859 RepID=A0A1I5VGQ1_9BACT|nr:OmpA family protein [Pseudarcicella hirudinis]SFQ06714.1 WD40-like Beta Propeller Repeat [Pseudarcicella hirudinis]
MKYEKLIKYLLFILCLVQNGEIIAQKVFWASKVVSFSSEYSDPRTTKEFRAIQVLGRPSKLPQIGSAACAWQPMTQDNPEEEFIIVSFDTLMPIRQVAVAENFGQGCIVRIEAFDNNANLKPLWENKSSPTGEIGKMLNVILPKMTDFSVKSIKLVLNTSRVKNFNQIDAIGISQSEKPVVASINVSNEIPKNFIKENLGKNINSEAIEIAPVIAPDGKTLYFTRWKYPENLGKDKNQDVWYSELQPDKSWGKAIPIGSPINNTEHNAVCGISPDGKTILLNNVYLKDGTMEKGVSKAFKLKTGGWGFPRALVIQNFRNSSEYSEYSLAPNGRVLLMTTQTKETFGGKDIYVSFLQADDTWSSPKNIGNIINTAEAESTPFIAPDGKTLYFSTIGHAGYGNNDIFMSRRLDDTWLSWSEPQNLGSLINTPEWDGYFSISALGDYAYFSSQENSMGQEDIFRLKAPESIKPLAVVQLTGQVFDSADKKGISARISVQDLSSPSDTLSTEYDPFTGDYKLMIPAKKVYSITARKKGYLPVSEQLDFTNEKNFKEFKKNLYLTPIEVGQKMTLNNVFFEQSKYDLNASSFGELDRIVELMKEYPTMEIMLEGHTDNQGDWNANLQLSQQRVEEVKKYLSKKGILLSRIQTKGWGSTRPVSSNLTEEKRRLNRRVEFTILQK